MFIFQLMGGIGNQMFQYAAARALSVKRGMPFKVHFEDPYKDVVRTYNLDIFQLKIEHANIKELKAIRPSTGLKRKVHQLFRFHEKKHFIAERQYFVYDPSLFSAPANSYLYGFWQTPKYFLDIEAIIREDFKFKDPAIGANKVLLNRIVHDANAVSLHIRRGDYVHVEKTSKLHGICSMEYYQAAAAYIAERITNPVFYIFSDDMNWVKSEFSIPYPVIFADINDDATNFEDLRLMSHCKHHIIANSSFSWWGAWLNNNATKIVIAPKKWANVDGLDTNDLIPDRWIRI